jgi:hypothetical protein
VTAQYRLSQRCFVQADGTASPWEHAAGEIVFFSGIPSRTWIALNDEAVAALAALAAASVSPIGITRAGKWDAWAG